MAIFQETFKIVNNSSHILQLDRKSSTDLGDGDWPSTVAPGETSASFVQTGNFNVKPKPVYNLQNSNPATNAHLSFYLAGVGLTVQVKMGMEFSPGYLFVGSSISENNSERGPWTTQTATTDKVTELEISTFGNALIVGDAIFTIGAG